MHRRSLFTLLLALEVGNLTAKVSPVGKHIGIEHTENTFQPYISTILTELVILVVLAILILLKVQSIKRTLKDKDNEYWS